MLMACRPAEVERICTETLDLHLKEHQFNEAWGSKGCADGLNIMSPIFVTGCDRINPNNIKISMFDCQLLFLKSFDYGLFIMIYSRLTRACSSHMSCCVILHCMCVKFCYKF